MEENSLEEFVNRFDELCKEARSYGIECVAVLHENDPLTESSNMSYVTDCPVYTAIGLCESLKNCLLKDVVGKEEDD